MLFLQYLIIDDIEFYKGYFINFIFLRSFIKDKKALKSIETILTLIPDDTCVKMFHCESMTSGYYERQLISKYINFTI